MVSHNFRIVVCCLLGAALLIGCKSPEPETVIPELQVQLEEEAAVAEGPTQEEIEAWQIEFRRMRMLGDLLYDALNALEEDRLLSPVDDNAYGRYQRVLAYDPGNKLALEGLQNIVARYLELAAEASRQGRFDDAQSLLDRARFVDQGNPLIRQAQVELEAEMNSGDLVFPLSSQALLAQSEELRSELSEIAAQAVEHDAFLLITAPNDEQARWVYGTMRESVDGYRLRGNIELGSQAIIRLRMPEPEPGDDPG